ncbi:ankyrin repeat-containing domain protein [Hypoxylon argillaceum]|nr:ankyrin repeat-containing domain protein [Hypoxylon argillaceum]
MLQFFHLPPELIIAMFDAIALSRSFKRLMRLRLVSRRFKFFVEHTVFSRPLPQFILDAIRCESLRHDAHPFYIEYLVHQAVVARGSACRFGRIRRTAVDLCEMAGDTTQDVLVEILRSLCFLSFKCDRSWFLRKQFSQDRSTEPTEPSSDNLAADLCVAAIYLGRHAHVEALINTQGWRFCDWGYADKSDLRSDVFGSAFTAATLRGDVSMIRLLLLSNPNYNPSEAIPFCLREKIFTNATWFGHKDAFDFAIDSGPLGVNKSNREICKYTRYNYLSPEYALVRRGVESTSVVDNYCRGVAMLLPHNNTGPKNFNDDLEWALGRCASEGHIDMVQYFLDSDPSPVPNRKRANKALRKAVQNGKLDVVSLLLRHGASPNRFSRLRTPLMFAAWTSSTSIARLLLESGAKPNVGRPPPIVLAVAKEDTAMFQLLWEYGARVDTPETGGWAMAVAQFWGFESMIDMLVEKGVERDAVLHRCPERRELAQLSWYLFLQVKDITGDDELAEALLWDDAISAT